MARIKDMTSGNPALLLVGFALQLMLCNVFQQLYTVVDTAIVGKALGVGALGALGATDWLTWMIIGMVQGLTQGFSIRMANQFGAKQFDNLRHTVALSVILSAFAALILLSLSQFLALPLLKLLKTPDEVISGSLLYIRYIFAGIPITTAFNLLAAILRALGDGKTPLYAMIVAALTNIALDLLFVLVFHWVIAGAAIATLIAQFFSCIFCYIHIRKIDILRLKAEDFRLSGRLVLHLLGLGTPMCLQNAIIAVGGMIIQMEVNRFGLIFLAGFTASNKLFGVLEIAGSSSGFALVSYVGQNLGAKDLPRIRKGVNQGAVIAILTSIVIGVIMLIFGPWFISCFISGSPEQVEQSSIVAYEYLAAMSVALPSLYILHAYRSSLQGLGDTVFPMISGILELFIRTGLVFTLPKFIGPRGIYVAEVSAWIGAAIMLLIIYYIKLHALAKKECLAV
ncbi:MAG: MATE family efflux transporter [Oscillospiraceae bacterium]|nr:MATE family efflux transporter [Oscillospiraceae bacterium]